MNKILVFVFTFFSLTVFGVTSLAQLGNDLQEDTQENPTSSETDVIDIVLSHETQDPATKEFFLVAKITSKFDSDRVVVEWSLPSGMTFAKDDLSRTTSPNVKAGEVTTVRKHVVPTYSGTNEVVAKVTMIKADVNYVSSDRLEIEFNQDREILPLTDEYKNAKLAHQITTFLIYSVIIVGGLIVLILVYKRVKSITT